MDDATILHKKWILGMTGGSDEGDRNHHHQQQRNRSCVDSTPTRQGHDRDHQHHQYKITRRTLGGLSGDSGDTTTEDTATTTNMSSWILRLTRSTTSSSRSLDPEEGEVAEATSSSANGKEDKTKINKFDGVVTSTTSSSTSKSTLPSRRFSMTDHATAGGGKVSSGTSVEGSGRGTSDVASRRHSTSGTTRLRNLLVGFGGGGYGPRSSSVAAAASSSDPTTASEFGIGYDIEDDLSLMDWGHASFSPYDTSSLRADNSNLEGDMVALSMTPTSLRVSGATRSSLSSNLQRQAPPPSYRLRTSTPPTASSASTSKGHKDTNGGGGSSSSSRRRSSLSLPGAYNVQGIGGGSDIPPSLEHGISSSDYSHEDVSRVGAFALYPQSSTENSNTTRAISADNESAPPTWLESTMATSLQMEVPPTSPPLPPSSIPASSSNNENKRWCVVATILLVTVLIMAIVILVSYLQDSGSAILNSNIGHTSYTENGMSGKSDLKFNNFRAIVVQHMTGIYGGADSNQQLESLLDDTSSPQYQALRWMATEHYDIPLDLEDEDDVVHPGSSSGSNSTASISYQYRVVQRYALAVMYYSMKGDTQWYDSFQFMSPVHECDWISDVRTSELDDEGKYRPRGIICDDLPNNDSAGSDKEDDHLDSTAVESSPPVQTRKHRRSNDRKVSGIIMDTNNLVGTIPKELHVLTNIELLHLQDNALSGNVPEALSKLTRLSSLDLSMNSLRGELPVRLAYLSDLKILRLGNNQLIGSNIRPILKDLVGLKELNVSNNIGMNGQILMFAEDHPLTRSRYGVSRDLEVFDIRNCSFSSQLSYTFFRQCPKLISFQADDNDIMGGIPVAVRNETATRRTRTRYLPLEEDENYHSSHFSRRDHQLFEDWGDNGMRSTLSVFTISRNRLTGTFPWTKLAAQLDTTTNFIRIDVSGNQLTGTLPSDESVMSKFSKLQYLDMSYNRLESSIPSTSIDQLHQLKELQLQGNYLTGSLPTELGKCTNLVQLALNDNSFTGTVPTELMELSNLRSVELQDNAFTGDVEFLCPVVVEPTTTTTATNSASSLRAGASSSSSSSLPEDDYAIDNDKVTAGISADCLGDLPKVSCTSSSCCTCY